MKLGWPLTGSRPARPDGRVLPVRAAEVAGPWAWCGGATAPSTLQEGLVNVNLSDIIVQVPVSVAANICDANVNVLAQQTRTGDAVCDAQAYSDADVEDAA